MVRNYIVYGVDRDGRRHELAQTSSALAARNLRDADSATWEKIIVYGADGALSRVTLNKLAALEEDDT